MQYSKSSSIRECQSNKWLYQETGKVPIKQPTLHLKYYKRRTKPKASRMKEMKIKVEITEKKKDIRKYRWNQELVLWKDKQNWQTLARLAKKKKERTQDKKLKRGLYNRHHRNTKDHKRLLRTIIQQQIWHSRRNAWISGNIQPTKSESRRKRKSELVWRLKQ